MKKIVVSTFLIFSCLASFSQSHNMKLNVTSLVGWRIGEVQYEYRLNDKIGLQLGAGAMIPRGNRFLSQFDIGGDLQDGETSPLLDLRMTGFRFTPEVKFYLGDGADNPIGFYVAPFLRYYQYNIKSDFSQFVNGTLESINHKTSFSALGGGIGIGTQWLIQDKVTIDVMWLRFGLSGGSIRTRLESSFDSEEWEEVEKEWQETSDNSDVRFIQDAEISRDANGVNLRMRNPMPVILRASVSVGYYF